MTLHHKLQQRAADGKPIRVGLIGAGKFGSMYLAQIPRTPGVHLAAIADLSPEGARANLARVGWKAEQSQASSIEQALKAGTTHVSEDWQALVRHPAVDVPWKDGVPASALQTSLVPIEEMKQAA